MKKITMEIQCPSCRGAGVYVGMAEREGAAVICAKCSGSGKYNFQYDYEDFTGRKTRNNISRVYKQSYGFIISPKKIFFDNIGEVDMTHEGVSYDEFLNGETPKHIKRLACPMLADQSACHKILGFFDECERLNGASLLGCLITECKHQPNKLKCWERFENGKG